MFVSICGMESVSFIDGLMMGSSSRIVELMSSFYLGICGIDLKQFLHSLPEKNPPTNIEILVHMHAGPSTPFTQLAGSNIFSVAQAEKTRADQKHESLTAAEQEHPAPAEHLELWYSWIFTTITNRKQFENPSWHS